ncbi:hypothetical protein FRC09_012059 [Ceratobasidium sp. 395]|nr:hypothetical protein FRC09_012059 [Ceratobasidium sp. 395]
MPGNKTNSYDPHETYQTGQDWGRRNGPKETARTGSDAESNTPVWGGEGNQSSPKGPWWLFGFQKKLSLGLFIVFAGAILGFSLARTPMLRFQGLLKITTPGEGYWYSKPIWKPNVMVHIWTSLPASFFSVFCFLPLTYNRWPRFHGYLGYVVSLLQVIACVCGAVAGRHAQGGDLNVQSAVYMMGSASGGAVVMGCYEAWRGDIAAHREWMLRGWFYNGTFVTTRVTALLSAQVITAINTYFSLWRCSEVNYVLNYNSQLLTQRYPLCGTSEGFARPDDTYVAVHSSWNEGRLGRGSASRASFGMALWVAMLLHFLGIELYLRMTTKESKWWREWSKRKATGSQLPRQVSRYADHTLANNAKGQSPCLVAAFLQAQCFSNKQWDVPVLTSGGHYLPPTGDVATGCACASPVYSLLSACAACQSASYITWGEWTANCPSAFINNGTFPFQVPSNTTVPNWAMKVVSPSTSFDIDAARGSVSDGGLSGAVIFLIVFLPIILLATLGFGGWIWWRRKQYRERAGSNAGREPLLRVDTTSDVHIHLTNSAGGSGRSPYDSHWMQHSPAPTTSEHTPNSAHPPSSPGHQYAYYPEAPAYYPNQPYLAPPSAATSAPFPASYHTPVPSQVQSQSQPPLTGATTNTFASQMQDRSRYSANPEPTVVENDSGQFPRTPVEPQLRSLPLGDPRNLLPPSVRANAPETAP